jgi:hypothetical protein
VCDACVVRLNAPLRVAPAAAPIRHARARSTRPPFKPVPSPRPPRYMLEILVVSPPCTKKLLRPHTCRAVPRAVSAPFPAALPRRQSQPQHTSSVAPDLAASVAAPRARAKEVGERDPAVALGPVHGGQPAVRDGADVRASLPRGAAVTGRRPALRAPARCQPRRPRPAFDHSGKPGGV